MEERRNTGGTTPVKELAYQYYTKNWIPVPVPKGTKAPKLTNWTEYTPTDFEDFTDSNIGVILGERSNWLTDIDIDDPVALKIADYFLPTTATFGRQGKPRSHRLFYCEHSQNKKYQLDGKMIIEIRSTGSQTIFPQSVHPTGEMITWYEEQEPIHIEWDKLRKAVGRIAAAVLLSKQWTQGTRQDLSLAIAGWLLRQGWSEDDVKQFLMAVCTLANDDEYKQRIKAIDYTSEKVRAGLPATGYFRLTGLIGKEMAQKLCEWLETKAEIQHKKDTKKEFSLSQLMTMELPPHEFIVSNFIPVGIVILAGRPKSGKSWLCWEILRAITEEGNVFANERFKAKKVKAFYYALEDSAGRIQERARIFFKDVLTNDISVGFSLQRLDNGGVAEIEDKLKQGYKLIIIDTYSRVKAGTRINEYETESEVLGTLQRLALDYQAAVILVHHTRKAVTEDFLDSVLGSTAITGVADAICVIRRQGKNLKVQETGRDLPPVEIVVNFDLDADVVFEYQGELEEMEMSETRREIIQYLKSVKKAYAWKIAKDLGRNYNTIRNIINAMVKEGVLVEEDGYKVAE